MYAIMIVGFVVIGALAGGALWLYHVRTHEIIAKYERLVDDMFDRKMASGDYQSYTYGKSVKAQQRVVQFLDELHNKKTSPDVMQMPSNRG